MEYGGGAHAPPFFYLEKTKMKNIKE